MRVLLSPSPQLLLDVHYPVPCLFFVYLAFRLLIEFRIGCFTSLSVILSFLVQLYSFSFAFPLLPTDSLPASQQIPFFLFPLYLLLLSTK